MLGRLGHRSIDLIVLLFALYAFAFVPLGRRTGLEHVRAIIGTREAQRAGEELAEAGDRLKTRMLDEAIGTGSGAPEGHLQSPRAGAGRPRLPHLPRGKPVQMRLVPADLPDAGADASLTE